MRIVKQKFDYSLSIRYKMKNGQWSEWEDKGNGIFINLEIVKKQIRTIASVRQKYEREVKFLWNGILHNYNGEPTGEPIKLNSK